LLYIHVLLSKKFALKYLDSLSLRSDRGSTVDYISSFRDSDKGAVHRSEENKPRKQISYKEPRYHNDSDNDPREDTLFDDLPCSRFLDHEEVIRIAYKRIFQSFSLKVLDKTARILNSPRPNATLDMSKITFTRTDL